MLFALIGILVGPLVIDELTSAPTGERVKRLAEATLAVVLFADASRIRPRVLRREYAVPLRLLGVGLPLTIGLGLVLAAVLFGQLNATEALVLAILLAPTDAALGEAVVTESRLPARIRQGLNVESGLNDGICVPLLLIALAAADVEGHTMNSDHAIRIVVEQIGYGVLGGVGAGLTAAGIAAVGSRRELISGSWLQVIPVAGAGLAYGIAVALVLLGPALEHLSWQIGLYAVLSLTVVRMLPVAVAMIGSGARAPTVEHGVVAHLGSDGEGHHRQLAAVGDQLVRADRRDLFGNVAGDAVGRALHPGVALSAQGQEHEVLGQHLAARPGEVQRECGHRSAQVVHIEHEVAGQSRRIAPDCGLGRVRGSVLTA